MDSSNPTAFRPDGTTMQRAGGSDREGPHEIVARPDPRPVGAETQRRGANPGGAARGHPCSRMHLGCHPSGLPLWPGCRAVRASPGRRHPGAWNARGTHSPAGMGSDGRGGSAGRASAPRAAVRLSGTRRMSGRSPARRVGSGRTATATREDRCAAERTPPARACRWPQCRVTHSRRTRRRIPNAVNHRGSHRSGSHSRGGATDCGREQGSAVHSTPARGGATMKPLPEPERQDSALTRAGRGPSRPGPRQGRQGRQERQGRQGRHRLTPGRTDFCVTRMSSRRPGRRRPPRRRGKPQGVPPIRPVLFKNGCWGRNLVRHPCPGSRGVPAWNFLPRGRPAQAGRGSVTVKVLPAPGALATAIRPPWASTIIRAM